MNIYHTRRTAAGLSVDIYGTDAAVTHISLNSSPGEIPQILRGIPLTEKDDLHQAGRSIEEYLSGKKKKLSIPFTYKGTPFQEKVWQLLREIPFGSTLSYGELAAELGGRHYARAAGGAVGANPLPIIIPCHRVIRSDGKLGGFSAGRSPEEGIALKAVLLRLEGISH